ncbi:MAG: cobalamin-independent methionine synthase II family protein [Sphingobium phenoxybenzoativorans]|uniref:Cobalamin-independent methionine synthase II family protein n=1 Tax=Sphingobium phenoxybenzoativorans TaxID=1592790 RepID=A0A975K739_9SPHN|nr:cobalamin-independent methionine synthase II family protein [Sphingobium phenoxybenzoativorans]QUT06023.1 cobalamin-independent methionine synthase II family protein [Sphingobium phenoxybenzoativorans]
MSYDRFLTTHVGSLPREDDLVERMFAQEDGQSVDAAALAARIEQAVHFVVTKQAEAGIDVINDGEQSKPSYATYIKDRLNGFGGTGNSYVFQDLEEFPAAKARIVADPGRKHRKTPACNAPISVKDMTAVEKDAATLTTALAPHKGKQAFMSAASPGVTALFFRNEYYDSDEAYLFALADGMRHEYEAIAAAGIILQIDCPDLAMGRHTQFRELSLSQFRDRIMLNVEAINRATANIPENQLRMHMCWGNYPGPHHCDVPFRDVIDLVWRARPHAIQFEAANPRHAHEFAMFEDVKLPEGKMLIPGVIECQSSYLEHPELVAQRIGRYAHLVGRDNVMAGIDCGFSIHVGSGGVPHEIVWAKLATLAEGAAIASRRFWP